MTTHSHELGGHLKYIVWQSGREKDNLGLRREVSVDVVDLVFEASVEEFVGFIQNEHLDVARAEVATADHVKDSAWCSRDHMLSMVELANVFPDGGAANAGVALNIHVVSQGQHNGLDLGGQLSGGRKNESLRLSEANIDGLEH